MDNDLLICGGGLCRFVIRPMDAIVQRLSDKNEYKPCAVLNAEPIPLTEEILEINGFVYEETLKEWWHKSYDQIFDMNISDFEITSDFYFGRAKITYVHEFQHALRLCGLIELADNFKV